MNKIELHNRRSIRLKGYDYSEQGAYFITICTHKKKCLFGKIIDGKMVLNKNGIIAHNELEKTPKLRKNIELGSFVIMPNHIHMIIIITRRGALHAPTTRHKLDISAPLEGACNAPLRELGQFKPKLQTIGSIIRGYKSSVTKQINIAQPIWHRNYYEHIIRNKNHTKKY